MAEPTAPQLPEDLFGDESPLVVLAGFTDPAVVTYASPNIERVLRWKPEDVIGVRGWLVKQLPAADRPRLAAAVRNGESGFQVVTRFRRGDGTQTWISLTGWLRPGEQPTGVGFLQEWSDVVAVRQAEKRLAVSLEQAERMEALARLSAGLAHDFNNLLSVIVNFTEFAAEELDSDPAAARSDLAEVAQAAARAAELTRKLSVFARRDTAELSSSDLATELAEAEPGWAERGAGVGVEVVVAPGAEALPVPLEAGRLRQLIGHLVDNAFDALAEGGRLVLAGERATVPEAPGAPADLPSGTYARLRVTDNGCGAPPEVVARMFEPFFTTRRRGVGSGLGLAVVHGVVGRVGGSISVMSTTGEGTTVDVWLPLGTHTAARAAAPGEAVGHGERLILVDDDLPVLEAARRILVGAGYDVIATGDPLEALGLIESGGEPIRGLVTDVVMPNMSGPELADAARRAVPGLPVLFVSGYAAGLLGPSEWLPPGVRMLRKPFTDGELLARVSESLAGA